MEDRRGDVTALLNEAGQGNPDAMRQLVPLVYDELRALAHRHRFQWRDAQSPGTASLVHEAYVKLVDQTRVRWESRAQFFYLASQAMRSILIDNARYFSRQKRGGSPKQVPLTDNLLVSEARSDELLELDEALTRLQVADDRLGRIVECRFFGGLTIEESAEALGLSPATVKRGWVLARAWLYRELRGGAAELAAGPDSGG
jgi:RNA polymerase sigma factor (TIGR02999 family)